MLTPGAHDDGSRRARLSRRAFLAAGLSLSGAALLAACGGSSSNTPTTSTGAAKATSAPTTGTTGATGTVSSQGSFPTTASPVASPVATQSTAAKAPLDKNQTLIIANPKAAVNLDPTQVNDANSANIYGQIHDTVAVLDPQFNLKPNLAESWEASSDGLTFTYHFRKGVKFHDGSPMTADDVVFTVQRILANKYPQSQKFVKIGMTDSVTKVDDYTVQLKLKFPYGAYPAAWGTQYILPKAVVEKVGDVQFSKQPVGCGPFKFVEWVVNDHITLEGFSDYWLTKPNLTKVVSRPITETAVQLANILSGDIDVGTNFVGSNLKQLQSAKEVNFVNKPGMSYYFAGFRMLDKPFTDLRFRQAVYYASDFDAAVKAIFPPELGQRAYGSVPPGLWPQDLDYLKSIALKQDQAKSKQLFQQLVSDGVMPQNYEIVIAPPPDDARVKIAEVMVTNLKEVGVNARMNQVDWAAYDAQVDMGPSNVVYFLGTIPAFPDPDANIRWLFGKDTPHGGYLNIKILPDDAQWDAQINKAEQSLDRNERETIYRDIERTMMQQVVHIPLYNLNTYLAERTYVKDFNPSVLFGWDLVRPWTNVYISGKSS